MRGLSNLQSFASITSIATVGFDIQICFSESPLQSAWVVRQLGDVLWKYFDESQSIEWESGETWMRREWLNAIESPVSEYNELLMQVLYPAMNKLSIVFIIIIYKNKWGHNKYLLYQYHTCFIHS